MKPMKIIVALGGNALGDTLSEQFSAVKTTAKAIADLIEAGHSVVITHGNGPQVGLIDDRMNISAALSRTPLSVCVAMSQAYIGYDLQNALREELHLRSIDRPVATIITQVRIDPHDPAMKTPTKPIGRFMSEEEARALEKDRGYTLKKIDERGFRRVVPSPKPVSIVELDAIRASLEDGSVVICCGGGGIPVKRVGHLLKGVSAVIDKDYVSALLAEDLDADMLMILTAVEKVSIRFSTPKEKGLDTLTPKEARAYIEKGEFARGSMLEKVEAAVAFSSSKPGRKALITDLKKAGDALNGATGTLVSM